MRLKDVAQSYRIKWKTTQDEMGFRVWGFYSIPQDVGLGSMKV